MTNIKHIVIIRFYCIDLINQEMLFDTNFLENGYNIFINYCLKSLENQTNKNFEILLLIHDEIPETHSVIQKLYNTKSNIKLTVLKYSKYREYLLERINNNDFMITTRMDHDDLVYSNAVEEIQNKCDSDIPFYFNGYDNVITMINDDYLNACKFYPNYNNNGAINIFQSVILNLKFTKQIKYNIYSLSHTAGRNQFKNWFVENNFKYKDEYFNINHDDDTTIYVKHLWNHSSSIHKSLEKWHRTNIKVNKSKEWFAQRFGKFIN